MVGVGTVGYKAKRGSALWWDQPEQLQSRQTKVKRKELTEYAELSDWIGTGSVDSPNKSYRGPDKSLGIIDSWAMVHEIRKPEQT